MTFISWLIPVFPLIGFLVIGLFGRKISKTLVGFIGCGSVLLSLILSIGVFMDVMGSFGIGTPTVYDIFNKNHACTVPLYDWISSGNLHVSFAFLIDPLSCWFLLIITGVGFLIHVYSVGYMHDDPDFSRFFSYLNLFIFFMLLLVLGDSYLTLFVGWEGVGLCSYLLIGFWFKNNEYNKAANKAFIMNRIGDLGFLLGIILIYVTFGSIRYTEVFDVANSFPASQPVIIAITLLLFVGAAGKSAQIPLYTWLPDAMAGPTPVSALIHAATMVTAGIYMIARSNILYTLAPVSMDLVAGVGLFTALFAATIGLFQNDIKKVLAYSTVSQLGYMFLGLGVGAYTGAVFHVTTHAFFKALLFLGAGSVIHAMSGEQDIRNMGGLKKYLRITFITFALGTIAISGMPPFSGFFSKDEILGYAWNYNKFFWLMGVLGSVMTAFYMFRLFYLIFYGKFRGTEKQQHHLHESPMTMAVPLIILAALSVVGGFIGFPEVFGGNHWLHEYFYPVFKDSYNNLNYHASLPSHSTEIILILFAVAAAGASITAAWYYYKKKENLPAKDGDNINPVQKTIYNKYYMDEIYATLFMKPIDRLSEKLHQIIELKGIDRIVNFFGEGVIWMSGQARLLQTGYTGFYIFAMVISIILILFYKLV
ncbi:MAG: NADH-quinone oxidoreductase subunit L [Bacteroidetes bacterium]|nr:MAG: NADH-quinone oxidoreductase subunit L [Bacteroidota bacterium]